MINHIQMAMSNRAQKVFDHSSLGWGKMVTPFLSSVEMLPYQGICKACDKAVKHPINADNFLEIIYVYKNDGNYKSKGNFFTISQNFTQDKFIEYTVKELLSSTNNEIAGHCVPTGLRIVASKIPIDVNSTKTNVWELTSNLKMENVEKRLELLGEYVIKKGVVEKHAFKPRKLKKPSRAKVSKSAKKRRNLKNKSKNKSKKRSPKPHRR